MMIVNDAPLCVLLVGKGATPDAAAEYLKMMRGCIYLSKASTSGNLVVAAFVLPESKRWWVESLADEPHLVGLEKIQLTSCASLDISSPWSRGEVGKPAGNPPCGANCATCPSYGVRCEGCAASRFYMNAPCRASAQPPAPQEETDFFAELAQCPG